MGKSINKNNLITVRLTDIEVKQLNELSNKLSKNKSEVVRELIRIRHFAEMKQFNFK